MKKKEIDIDEILNQINLCEQEVFTLNDVVRVGKTEEFKKKLNWSGMHENSFRLRLWSGECKSTKISFSKFKSKKNDFYYQITKDNLLDWLEKQNYGK